MGALVSKKKAEPVVDLAARLAGHVGTVKTPMSSSGEPSANFVSRIRRARAARYRPSPVEEKVKPYRRVLDDVTGIQMGKRDSWEVPMDHFEPARPRQRPNYRDGSGNVVGKRITATGAVAGVAKPKKVQATRTAARTAPRMLPIGTPPIPPSMVGKRFFSAGQRRKMASRGQANPDGSYPIKSQHDVVNAERLLHFSSPAKQAEVRARIRSFEASKRDRSYNPEHNRQRRLGLATAATAAGGIALGTKGIRGVRAQTRVARTAATREADRLKRSVNLGHEYREVRRNDKGAVSHEVPLRWTKEDRAAPHVLGAIPKHMVAKPTRRQSLEVGGGAALVATSGGLHHYSRSRANREWR